MASSSAGGGQHQAVIRTGHCKSLRRRDGLIKYAHDVHSQCGEDGILQKIFCGSEAMIPSKLPRYLVDVGAWDGKHLSNSHELLVTSTGNNWRGVLIEADDEKFTQLEKLHLPLGNVCVHKTVTIQNNQNNKNTATLSEILKTVRFHDDDMTALPCNFDFLCIDVDGPDYWLLHNVMTNGYTPKLICVEFNPTMPNNLVYIPPNDDSTRHGASLAALVELMQTFNYVLVETTLYNAFFVPMQIYNRQNFQQHLPENHDTSIEALHETTMGTSLYQLYDGTLKLHGCKKLLWHRLPIEEQSIQVLPNKQPLSFPFAPNQGDGNRQNIALNEITDPVVDVSAYCKQQGDKNECSRRLIQCLQQDGFVLVQGTGISRELCEKALQATHAFLQEAPEAVRRSAMSTHDRARRGYAPSNTENFGALLGTKNAQNDHVRKFRIGPVHDDGSQQHHRSTLHQPNIWPRPLRGADDDNNNDDQNNEWDADTCRSFQSTCETYYQVVCVAADAVLRAICDGLLASYPELQTSLGFLVSKSCEVSDNRSYDTNHGDSSKSPSFKMTTKNAAHAHHTGILTLLGYQVGPRHRKLMNTKNNIKSTRKSAIEGYPLVAAHTDVGVITMLLFHGGADSCAILQRENRNVNSNGSNTPTSFQNVHLPSSIPQDPVFVINVADCLSALTGGKLPSTVHRVMPQIAEKCIIPSPRNCVALFVGLNPMQKLQFPDTCNDKTQHSSPTTYEIWRKKRILQCQEVMEKNS
jgi:isopenicillin N synthase-like dioxygenase